MKSDEYERKKLYIKTGVVINLAMLDLLFTNMLCFGIRN